MTNYFPHKVPLTDNSRQARRRYNKDFDLQPIKYFPHKVLLTDNSEQARRWCNKEFGLQPIKWRNNWKCRGRAYDLEEGIWYNKASRSPNAFYFKCPANAMAFKLRWA